MESQRRSLAARIQNRLAPNMARWLRRIRHPGMPDQFLARQFGDLLQLLKANDCSFHSCTALGGTPVPGGVAFRYDIHLRDLDPAYDFLAFHLRENIPATFFLMWDHSRTERSRLKNFLIFAKKVKKPVELGLHDSPVDAFLIEAKFSGDAKAYRRWAASDDAIAWLETLAATPELLTHFHADALELLKRRVQRTCEHFGNIAAIAPHGGELVQGLRERMATLKPASREIATSLFAQNWLTQERVVAAGLTANVEYSKRVPTWKEVSDRGGSRIVMQKKIEQALASGNAVQALLHPNAWLKREP